MKKLKVSFLALAAVFAVCLSAFTTPKHVVTTEGWFTYDPSQPANLASSYTYVGEMSPCSGEDALCAIKGTRNTNPTILTPFQSDVDAAKTASGNFSHAVSGQVDFRAE